jgi:hypothetical protein
MPYYNILQAQTVFGALHALEVPQLENLCMNIRQFAQSLLTGYLTVNFVFLQTFSQLCNFDFNARLIELHSAPWTIMDMPRFPYRGLLIGMLIGICHPFF